jgi:hypothetical protein
MAAGGRVAERWAARALEWCGVVWDGLARVSESSGLRGSVQSRLVGLGGPS